MSASPFTEGGLRRLREGLGNAGVDKAGALRLLATIDEMHKKLTRSIEEGLVHFSEARRLGFRIQKLEERARKALAYSLPRFQNVDGGGHSCGGCPLCMLGDALREGE